LPSSDNALVRYSSLTARPRRNCLCCATAPKDSAPPRGPPGAAQVWSGHFPTCRTAVVTRCGANTYRDRRGGINANGDEKRSGSMGRCAGTARPLRYECRFVDRRRLSGLKEINGVSHRDSLVATVSCNGYKTAGAVVLDAKQCSTNACWYGKGLRTALADSLANGSSPGDTRPRRASV